MWERLWYVGPSLNTSVFIFCAACFLAAFSAAIYVSYRFLAVIVSIDAAFSRSRAVVDQLKSPVLFPQATAKPASTSGGGSVEPYDEAAMYVAEQVRAVKGSQGLSDEELQRFIAHARGVDVDLDTKK